MAHFTNHARDRALDRYNMALTDSDFQEIYGVCAGGKALLGSARENARIYIMEFRGKRIVPLLTPANDRIITFLPSDFFAKGSRRAYYQGIGVAKQRSAAGRKVGGGEYRRERISVCNAMEDEE